MSEARVAGGAGRLSIDLAASLEPSLQDALNHPLRREILRVLNGGEGAETVAGLLGRLSPYSRGEVSYNLQILRRSHVVAIAGSRPGPAGREHLYESTVRENERIAAVLRVTQLDDRERGRERAARHSSGLLTMFRVPRPTRSIRLGAKTRTELER